jgi:capsular polysaccharide transport system permease protein
MRASPPPLLPFFKSILLLVLAPTLALIIYWAFVYTPVYEAGVVALPRNSEVPTGADAAGAMLGAALRSKDVDSHMVEQYILSPDMLQRLDAALNLREHYSSENINWWQRLPREASFDRFLEYYRKMVRVVVDSSSILHIETRGFSPEKTLELADRIVSEAEDMLNGVSKQLAAKQVEFIRIEVMKAESLFRDRTQKLTLYQNTAGQLDPARYSESIMAVIARMERELAEQNTRIAGHKTFLAADAPQLVEVQSRIDALTTEITTLRSRLTGGNSPGATPLSDEIMKFNDAALETEFAAKTYSAALLALQGAHAQAALNIRTLIIIAHPSSLEDPAYPRLGYWTLATLALFTLIAVLGRLIYDSVMCHMDR